MFREPSPQALSLFYCYAPADAALRAELEKHLEPMRRERLIQSWHAQEILPGEAWKEEITSHIRAARIIVLLVSADFLASEDCYSRDLAEALHRHSAGEAIVLPLILRPVDWQHAPFSQLKVLPAGGKPVTTWENRDEAFLHIAQGIRDTVQALQRPVLFLSSPAQEALASRLAGELETRGLPLYRQASATQNASQEEITEYVRRSAGLVLVVSPELDNLRLLKKAGQAASIYQRLVIVVRAREEGQEELPLPEMFSGAIALVACSDQETDLSGQILVHCKKRLAPVSEALLPVEAGEPRNPYKALNAFGSEDAAAFFGREKVTADLLAWLAWRLHTATSTQPLPPLLALIGPSGSGKSSIVQAGLLPRLRQGACPGSSQWLYLAPIVPGENPLEALAQRLHPHFPEKSFATMLDELTDMSTRGLSRYGQQLTASRGGRVVLVIDQFEELFFPGVDEEKRGTFLDVLLTAVTAPRSPFVVILTLRADFYARSMEYPEFHQLLVEAHYDILPMNVHELRRAIEQPAHLPEVQLTFEGDLVSELLLEMLGQPAALPFLQFTLDYLFRERVQRTLGLSAYHAIGGIRGALTQRAEYIYSILSEAQSQLARFLFLRLVNPALAGSGATRRRARMAELALSDPGKHALLQATIAIFINERLLTAGEMDNQPAIEISHEALLEGWPRLAGWIEQEQQDIQVQQKLSRDASAWARNQYARDWLYRGQQLKQAKAWATRNLASQQEAALLRASLRAQRGQRLLLTSIFLLCVVLIGGLVYFWPVTAPLQGQHDSDLNVYFTGLQASTYMSSDNATNQPDGSQAESIAAQRIDKAAPIPYGVVLSVHSLHQGDFVLLLENVRVKILQALALPDPLRVIPAASPRSYTSNIFQAVYPGAGVSFLDAAYTYQGQHVQLASGETDTLTIQLSSLVKANLQFQIQLTYRLSNETQEHVFLFTTVFHAVFSDASDWYPLST